jgi:hypothetical protein
MRKGLAGLILGLSLVVASISWAGFIMSRTVLDPGRSERLAVQVFENEDLRSVLVTRLAESLGEAIPGEIVVPTQTLEAAASLALDDPQVQGFVQQAIVDTHRRALEGDVQPVVLDSNILSNALRTALVGANPELESAVPALPAATVELPTSGLNVLGTLKNFVDQVTILAALAALAGGVTALVITNDRPSVLRRVAFWAFGAALFWLIVGFGVPYLAALIGPASSALITAAIDVFFGAMIRPAIFMGAVGVGLVVVSIAWTAAAERQPARVAQPARTPRGQGAVNTANRIGTAAPTAPVEGYGRPLPRQPADQTVVQSVPLVAEQPPGAHPGPTAPSAGAGPAQQTTPTQAHDPAIWTPEAPKREPIWIEGRGYVDPDDPTVRKPNQ